MLGRVQLAHVDLYRLEQSAELADLGLGELLDEGVVAVEWGDRLTIAGGRVIRIGFQHRSESERVITLP